MLDARLAAAGHWIAACEAAPKARPRDTLEAAIAANKRDFDARFELAQTPLRRASLTQAMDELLEILMRDKAWKRRARAQDLRRDPQVMTKPAPARQGRSRGAEGRARGRRQGGHGAGRPGRRQYRRKLSMALF